jgi:murein DD-endopeptidase MepM/ murein hydrolase activator NlpD
MIPSSPVQLSLDAKSGVLTVSNRTAKGAQVVYVTATAAASPTEDAMEQAQSLLRFQGRDGQLLELGTTRRDSGSDWQPALTLVVTVPPSTELRLATLASAAAAAAAAAAAGDEPQPLKIFLDTFVFPFLPHPGLAAGQPPLQPVELQHWPADSEGAPLLCTQGIGGRLTHFFPESFHAVGGRFQPPPLPVPCQIAHTVCTCDPTYVRCLTGRGVWERWRQVDFRCAVGTPLLAVGDGVVTACEAVKSASGISCLNLTEWNALTLRLDPATGSGGGGDGGQFVADYVHIQPGSALVPLGTRVKAGDPICLSGSVGFSPEPHLHLEVHPLDDPMGERASDSRGTPSMLAIYPQLS